MIGGAVLLWEDERGERRGRGAGDPEAVEALAGLGAEVEVSPGLAIGIGGGKGLPQLPEGIEEGVVEGGVEVTEEDEPGGGPEGGLELEEVGEGKDSGPAFGGGIGVAGIGGVAALEVDMEEAEKGRAEADGDFLDPALEGAAGIAGDGVMEDDFLEGEAGENGQPGTASGFGGEGGMGKAEPLGGQVEAQFLEEAGGTDLLEEKEGRADLEEEAADGLLAGLRHGVVEAVAAFLKAVDGGEVAEIPSGDGGLPGGNRGSAQHSQEEKGEAGGGHPSWRSERSRSRRVGWE